MKLYLAGPMRGYPEFNSTAFHSAAAMLRAQGYEVFNPAERDEKEFGVVSVPSGNMDDMSLKVGMTALAIRRNCFKADTDWICTESDGIFLLKGWSASKGARAEKALIEALDLPVYYAADAEVI